MHTFVNHNVLSESFKTSRIIYNIIFVSSFVLISFVIPNVLINQTFTISKKQKTKTKKTQTNKQTKNKAKSVFFSKNCVSAAIKFLKFLRIDLPSFQFFNFPSPDNFEKRIVKSILFKTEVHLAEDILILIRLTF